MLMMSFSLADAVVVSVASFAVAVANSGAIAVAVAVAVAAAAAAAAAGAGAGAGAAAAAAAVAVPISGIATFTMAFAVLSLMMASMTFVAMPSDITFSFTLLWSLALSAVNAALLEESQLSLAAAVFATLLTPCCLGLAMLLFYGSGDADDVRFFFVAQACQLRFAEFLMCLISL
jgi:hypothetical protein